MCGRIYNIIPNTEGFEPYLGNWPDDGLQSYNIAPSQTVPIITQEGTVQARWGLIPNWSDEFKSKYSTFNARIESVQNKPLFKNAWRAKRGCVVPIGGYYEWKQEGGDKQPYAICYPDRPMFLAGLWESWNENFSFTVLTQPSSGNTQGVHNRMPLVVEANNMEAWFSDLSMENDIQDWANEVSCYKISKSINNPRNEFKEVPINI
jgi:putative SOS response-associated peptidase YedK